MAAQDMASIRSEMKNTIKDRCLALEHSLTVTFKELITDKVACFEQETNSWLANQIDLIAMASADTKRVAELSARVEELMKQLHDEQKARRQEQSKINSLIEQNKTIGYQWKAALRHMFQDMSRQYTSTYGSILTPIHTPAEF